MKTMDLLDHARCRVPRYVEACEQHRVIPFSPIRKMTHRKCVDFYVRENAGLRILQKTQRQGPPGFQVFVNEFPSCTVRTGRARKSRMASITALNSTFST
jgi:hypothetical protein